MMAFRGIAFFCSIKFSTLIAALDIQIGWEEEYSLDSRFATSGCDLPVLHAQDLLTQTDLPTDQYAYVVKGLVDDWPANERWKKNNFLRIYGEKSVRTGSESSIVNTGGRPEDQRTLAELIAQMHQKYTVPRMSNESLPHGVRLGDTFVFDSAVLSSIPELKHDFSVPGIFSSWDRPDREKEFLMWHLLSIGPSNSGLPFHNHGQTWLAVVHGKKKWFLYPPGYDAPSEVDAQFNPMFPVSEWLGSVYERIQWAPKPPAVQLQFSEHLGGYTPVEMSRGEGASPPVDGSRGYRPLECVQEPGDVLYLPTRWSHLTMNIGETIAIGAQERLSDEERAKTSHATLEKFPNSFDARKDYALALANMGNSELQSLRSEIHRLKRSYHAQLHQLHSPPPCPPPRLGDLIEFPEGTPLRVLNDLLLHSKDTWVVLYYDSSMAGYSMHDLSDVAIAKEDADAEEVLTRAAAALHQAGIAQAARRPHINAVGAGASRSHVIEDQRQRQFAHTARSGKSGINRSYNDDKSNDIMKSSMQKILQTLGDIEGGVLRRNIFHRTIRSLRKLAKILQRDANVATFDVKGLVREASRSPSHTRTAPTGGTEPGSRSGRSYRGGLPALPLEEVYKIDYDDGGVIERAFSKLPALVLHCGDVLASSAPKAPSGSSDSSIEVDASGAAAAPPSSIAVEEDDDEQNSRKHFNGFPSAASVGNCSGDTSGSDAGNDRGEEGSTFSVDEKGIEYRGRDLLYVESLQDFVLETMRQRRLAHGAVMGISVAVRSLYVRAVHSFSIALESKPLHPEVIALCGEVAGLARDFDTMHRVLQHGARILDAIDRAAISPLSLASSYHKLASSYLETSLYLDTLEMLERSVEAQPEFMLAWRDLTTVYTETGRREEAIRAFGKLTEALHPLSQFGRDSWRHILLELEEAIKTLPLHSS